MLYSYETGVGKHHGPQHTHDFHEFFFCRTPPEPITDDTVVCVHYIEDAVVPTYVNDLIFLPAGQGHICVNQISDSTPCMVFYFSDDEVSSSVPGDVDAFQVLQALIDYTQPGRNRIPLTPEASQTVLGLLRELATENTLKAPGWRCALKHHYMHLLLSIYRGWAGTEKLGLRLERAEAGERMRDVLHFIDNQYMNPIGVEDVLRISCLSRSHFHALFKSAVGQTFKEYLNSVRIGKARAMLTQSEMPISQIALSCGFSSQSRFNTVFRSVVGYAPGCERRANFPTV